MLRALELAIRTVRCTDHNVLHRLRETFRHLRATSIPLKYNSLAIARRAWYRTKRNNH